MHRFLMQLASIYHWVKLQLKRNEQWFSEWVDLRFVLNAISFLMQLPQTVSISIWATTSSSSGNLVQLIDVHTFPEYNWDGVFYGSLYFFDGPRKSFSYNNAYQQSIVKRQGSILRDGVKNVYSTIRLTVRGGHPHLDLTVSICKNK